MSVLGVVVAGGRNTRFGDIKAFAQVGGTRIIDRVISALRDVADAVVLSANDPAFAGLEMALFVDAGKTVPEKGDIFRSEMNYSGGIGFRARVNDAIVLRFDIAKSREGLRWIWSMSDISRRRF